MSNGKLVAYKMHGKPGVDYDTLPFTDGKAIVVMSDMNVGTHKWGGLVEWNTNVGTIRFPFQDEYIVVE